MTMPLLRHNNSDPAPEIGIPTYAMIDVWMALGGTPAAFDRMEAEDRRTKADTWSQLLAVVRGDDLAREHNPPAGPEFDRLVTERV